MPEDTLTLLDKLKEQRKSKIDSLEAEIAKVEAETREPSTEESESWAQVHADIKLMDERISVHEDLEKRKQSAAQGAPRVEVRKEPLTYSRHAASEERISYFKDLTTVVTRGVGMNEAEARLARHGKEMDVELPRRAQRREENAEKEVRNAIGYDAPTPFEKRVNPNRTDGQGGYLVPPLWLMDELIPILRAGRVVANQVRGMDLPEGTDSINIPKLSTGTTVAIQTGDAGSVSSTDFTDTSVSAGVKTLAGQQDVSIQLVEQSPLSLDEILFRDLIADYNKKLDAQVIAGSNANGQVNGLYSSAGASNWTGYSTITYTDGSPTQGEFWAPMAQSLSKIAQARFDLSSVKVFMHPRRWFWIVGGLDTTNRPLVVPAPFGSFNAMGSATGPVAEGYVGNLTLGAPVFIDANITTADTAGSGSGQDISIALKTDDALLFEGQMRQRTLPEVLSGTLQVRFQVYNYIAFLLRYGEALAIGSGTGYAAPTGY